MDQDAFRSLLTAPREGGSSSRSRGVLGGAAPKRGWGLKPRNEGKKKSEPQAERAEGSKPAFVPRAHQKKVNEESKYKDRAAMRRQGDAGEFQGVSALLEDFEKRKAEAGANADLVEAQRVHLGGDEEHSVLVKGLDFALLAKRKAELEREKLDKVDDELEDFGREIGSKKGKEKQMAEDTKAQRLAGRFKSIAQRKAEAEAAAAVKKAKKKKAKGETSKPDEITVRPQEGDKKRAREIEAPRPEPPAAKAPPPDPEDEEDIFADAGTYDLTAALVDAGDDDEEEGAMSEDELPPRGRTMSRSRSRSRSRSFSRDRSRSRDMRSPSRDRSYSRGRSYSRDRSYSRERSYSRDSGYRRSRSCSLSRDRYRDYDRRGDRRDDRRDRYRRDDYSDDERYDTRRDRDRSSYRDRSRYNSYRDDRDDRGRRYRSRSRSESPRRTYRDDRDRRGPARGSDRNDRGRRSPLESSSRHPSGQRSRTRSLDRGRRSYSRSDQSRSPAPTRAVARSRSRSPTPLLAQTLPIYSRSPTPDSDEDDGPITRLKPLASSAIADVRGFLEADIEGAKADEKRLRKARWRAQQGMSTQDGIDPEMLKKKELTEKQKTSREYQLVMNRVKKQSGDA